MLTVDDIRGVSCSTDTVPRGMRRWDAVDSVDLDETRR